MDTPLINLSCLFCGERRRRLGKPAGEPLIARWRGACETCHPHLRKLLQSGAYTDEELVANGWLLPRKPNAWKRRRPTSPSPNPTD